MSGRLRLLAQQLRISITERNRLLAMGVEPVHDDEDEMRHSLGTLRQGIEGLDDNGTAYKSDAIQDDLDFLRTEFRELQVLYGIDQSDLEDIGASIAVPYHDDADYSRRMLLPERLRKSVRFTDSLADSNLDNGDLLQLQSQVMREQDSSLDTLSVSISRQRELSIQIGNELDEQGEILEDVDTMVGRSSTRLDHARNRLTTLSRKAKEHNHLLAIVILVIILILLLGIQ